jgi:hypothetical protein
MHILIKKETTKIPSKCINYQLFTTAVTFSNFTNFLERCQKSSKKIHSSSLSNKSQKTMKWIFRAASGFVFVIVSVILGWLVSIHEIDWLANLNENRHLSPQEYEEHSDWNSDVRAGRMERQYFEHHDEPLVHSSRCDACRLIASKFHHALELAEHKLGIRTHSFDEYEELGKS